MAERRSNETASLRERRRGECDWRWAEIAEKGTARREEKERMGGGMRVESDGGGRK